MTGPVVDRLFWWTRERALSGPGDTLNSRWHVVKDDLGRWRVVDARLGRMHPRSCRLMRDARTLAEDEALRVQLGTTRAQVLP